MDEIKIPDFMDDSPVPSENSGENSTKDEKQDFVIDITKSLEAFLDEAGIGEAEDSKTKKKPISDDEDADDEDLDDEDLDDEDLDDEDADDEDLDDEDADDDNLDDEDPDDEDLDDEDLDDEDPDDEDLDDEDADDEDLDDELFDLDKKKSAVKAKKKSGRTEKKEPAKKRNTESGNKSEKNDRVSRATVSSKKKTEDRKSGANSKRKTAKELKASLDHRLKTRKFPTSWKEVKDGIDWEKWKQRKKVILPLVYISVLLLLILGISTLIKYHTWKGYAVSASNDEEDTVSYSYTYVGKNVLRYGIDSARLMDADYNIIWSDSYTMSNPAVEICGDTVCIYDKGGSVLVTYDQNGKIGVAASELPIVKATVAAQGVAAVICESSTETWIKYYSTDGSTIASFRTDMDSPGYPMDVALSPDGLSMTVSYAFVEAGQINTQIAFYNFGSLGQNLVDNLIKVETYDDILAPQVEYVGDDTCIVFFEDGFRVFQGVRKPTEIGDITLEQTILSYDASENGVVFVLRNEGGAGYQIKMFTLRGRGIFTGEFDFAYHGMTVESDKILFYNSQEMMLYSMAGVKKFEGSIDEGVIKTAMDLGKNRYLLVTDQGIRTIRLT